MPAAVTLDQLTRAAAALRTLREVNAPVDDVWVLREMGIPTVKRRPSDEDGRQADQAARLAEFEQLAIKGARFFEAYNALKLRYDELCAVILELVPALKAQGADLSELELYVGDVN